MKRVVCVIFLALILSSCRAAPAPVATPTPDNCSSKDITEFITTMNDAAQQFEGLAQTAEETAPENLEPVIKEMQEVRQGVEKIDTPPCTIKTKAALDYYMSSTIQCNFGIYAAVIVVEESQLPDPKTDSCSLASDQLGFYNAEMAELEVLLLEKSR